MDKQFLFRIIIIIASVIIDADNTIIPSHELIKHFYNSVDEHLRKL